MSEYLYYKRGNEWVRVAANSYTRETTAGADDFTGGQCPVLYKITGTYQLYIRSNGKFDRTSTFSIDNVIGPISSVRAFNDGGTNKGIAIDANGTQRQLFGSGNAARYELRNFLPVIARQDNQPDNCGSRPTTGVCTTIFKLAGSTVLTLASCPEVTKGDECSDCCGELLTIAKRIAA